METSIKQHNNKQIIKKTQKYLDFYVNFKWINEQKKTKQLISKTKKKETKMWNETKETQVENKS